MMWRTQNCRRVLSAMAAVAIAAAAAGHAQAQAPRNAAPPSGPPNALQGFSQNHDQPVRIESDTLDVRTKDNVATFSGKVHVVQGDVDMRARSLVVFYEEKGAKDTGVRAAQPGPGGSSQIKRLEAIGNVVVSQKDQTVTGDKGVFDMRANTVTLSGNVVATQCQNVMRGERLIVDLTTGASRVEGGNNRVQGLFQRGGNGSDGCKDAPKTPGAR